MLCLMVGCGRTEPGGDGTQKPMAPGNYCEAIGMLNLDFQGVWTNPNAHSKVPAGAALRAENMVSDARGVAACVTGQRLLSEALAPASRMNSATVYQGHIVESYASGKLARRNFASPALTAYSGSYLPASGVRMRFAEAGGDLYLPTSTGLKVLDGVTSTPADVGVPRPVNARNFAKSLGGTTVFSYFGSVAYRWAFGREDSEGVMQLSEPSGRYVFDSDSASPAFNVTMTINLPAGIVAGDHLLLYRTNVVNASMGPIYADPGDIGYLAIDYEVTSGDVTTGSVVLVDQTPDELRGAPLYTNATVEGILRANERPPLAQEMVLFQDRLLLGNVRPPQLIILRMLGTMTAGDTLTIAGQAYTAKVYTDPTDPDYTAGEFEFFTGYSTVSENIYYTAMSLIDAINRTTSNTTVYAHYLSGPNDPPGIIGIVARSPTTAAFNVQATAGTASYEPPLINAQSSYADEQINGIWVSKQGRHYAYPRDSRFRLRVGTGTRPVTRLIALRTAVYAFVQQEGIWRITYAGDDRWRVEQVSNTAHLLVPDSVAVVDDRIFALTTRGLVAVDESGVQEVGVQIRDKFDAIAKLPAATVQAETFAVADDARQRYILYHPLTPGSDTSDHAWVYNGATDVWTERTDEATGGLVNGDNGLLYLGLPTGEVTEERYGEDVDVYKNPDNSAIEFRLVWTVLDEGNPGAQKRFTEMKLLTRNAFSGNVVFDCTNDLGGEESVTGVAENTPYCLVWVPDGVQRTSRLLADIQREVLGESFEVVGMDVKAKTYGGRLTRN
jgi:hypothetical protein